MMRIKKSLMVTVFASSALLVQPVCATLEPVVAQDHVRLQQVALFKNGLGFLVSEVTIPDNKSSFNVIPQAAASHGTFWVSYPPKVEVESLIAKEVESEQQVEAVTIPELLMANVGRKVNLAFDDEQIAGVIKRFAEDRQTIEPSPYAPGRTTETSSDYRSRYSTPSRLMVVETDDGQIAIDPQMVKTVEFLDGKAEKMFSRKSKSMRLDIKLSRPAGGQKLTVSYLAKGITWAPSYMVDIADSDKARIAAKAAIINEICDLHNVSTQLVTGFPHLQFADVVSPLAVKEKLAQFLQALTKGESERGRSREAYVMSQRAGGYGGYPVSSPAAVMPAYGAAEAGKVAEDLFLYPIENVQLEKGEVGYYPLFTESVPYKHIYRWDIPDYVSEEERYQYDRSRQQELEREEEVWHCLRLQNTTRVPWTTAPAETVKEGIILGQDTLEYTPIKAETTLRITRAVSVKAEQVEHETDRKRDAAQLYGHHYDLVTVEGKLSVANFQPKPITLEITKTLSGEVKSSDPKATIETLARGLRRMNAVRKLTWTIELKPAEEKQLSYVYEVYVRR
jgi:hypothetical protein